MVVMATTLAAMAAPTVERLWMPAEDALKAGERAVAVGMETRTVAEVTVARTAAAVARDSATKCSDRFQTPRRCSHVRVAHYTQPRTSPMLDQSWSARNHSPCPA